MGRGGSTPAPSSGIARRKNLAPSGRGTPTGEARGAAMADWARALDGDGALATTPGWKGAVPVREVGALSAAMAMA
eukprot:5804561-Pyramimonas_sp.AAC.1